MLQKFCVAAIAIGLLTGISSVDSVSADPMKQLQHRVTQLKTKQRQLLSKLRLERRQRRAAERQTREAEAALRSGLPAQVAHVGSTALLPEIQALIMLPLEAAWPCGKRLSGIVSGQRLWSLSLELEAPSYDEDCPRSG